MKDSDSRMGILALPYLPLAEQDPSRADTHQLTWSKFHDISLGQTKPEEIDTFNALTAARNRRVLNRLVKDVSVEGFDETAGLGFVHTMRDTLSQAEQKDENAYRTVWTYPFFNGLANRVSDLLINKGPQYWMSEQVATRIAYETGATVAATAIRCDVPCDVKAYVHEHKYMRKGQLVHEYQLVLPSLGTLQLPDKMTHVAVTRTPHGEVNICDETTGFQMKLPRDLSQPTEDWRPVRTLHAEAEGHSITVALDDLHYNRSAFSQNFTGRLSGETVARWQQHFQGAWEVLCSHVPELALAAAGVLRVIIPHNTQTHGYGMFTVSNSAAYGAVGMSIPDSPVNFAKEILHETGHNILDKLHELLPSLSQILRYENQVYYSPWRQDPRPLGGHVHGIYAHSILANFSRVLAERATTDEDRQRFAVDFARWRAKVKVGTMVLAKAIRVENLEPDPRALMGGIIEGVLEIQNYPISERLHKLGYNEVADHYNAWMLTNMQVDPVKITALAKLFLHNRAVLNTPGGKPTTSEMPDAKYVSPRNRNELFAKHRLFDIYQNNPAMFQALRQNPALLAAFKGTIPPDVALVNGDYEQALNSYEQLIEQSPDSAKFWPGFLIALQYCCRSDPQENRVLGLLLIRPDILQPLYAEVTKKMPTERSGRIRPRDFVEQAAAMFVAKNDTFEYSEDEGTPNE